MTYVNESTNHILYLLQTVNKNMKNVNKNTNILLNRIHILFNHTHLLLNHYNILFNLTHIQLYRRNLFLKHTHILSKRKYLFNHHRYKYSNLSRNIFYLCHKINVFNKAIKTVEYIIKKEDRFRTSISFFGSISLNN